MTLLKVEKLNISYAESSVPIVTDMSFELQRGGSLGIVGESGSGKTQTALAILGLSPRNAMISGSIRFDGTDLTQISASRMNALRACRIAMIFQDPMTALNPFVRIGDQLRRVLVEHRICDGNAAKIRTLEMLGRVGLPDPDRQYRAYSHELSGGMRQRAMIGAALLGEPDLLIADEPTTALDVTVQAQVLRLLRDLRNESKVALMLITHDLGVVAGNCENMLVMKDGRLIEQGRVVDIFANPSQEETARLLSASPRVDFSVTAPVLADSPDTVMDIDRMAVSFRERHGGARQELRAVQKMSLSIRAGETVAIVGESGSGKTSLARALMGLIPADSGTVSFLGTTLAGNVAARSNRIRGNLQMVFQDPLESLNPSMKIGDIVSEPLRVHGRRARGEAREVTALAALKRVGLSEEFAGRLPHELSGGQAQRVAIARALVLEPAVLVCDEAVAALDGTVQNEILSLLQSEQQRHQLAIIFITHDLAVVRQISHRVLVMYMGQICELAENETLFARPRHPYTKALLDAVPVPDPQAAVSDSYLAGEPGSIVSPPTGCPFHPRCAHAIADCAEKNPDLQSASGSAVACHRALELDLSY